MQAIKIVSNPYRKTIEFFSRSADEETWEIIAQESNPGSKLISEEIRTGFFPYKIREIIDIILKEYGVPGEILQIVFEGSDDEFEEIVGVCRNMEDISLERSSFMLENASGILPRIMGIFGKVKPIVDKNIEDRETRDDIEENIAKLLDASNDVIPICVLGNYSSGKSTFINAG